MTLHRRSNKGGRHDPACTTVVAAVLIAAASGLMAAVAVTATTGVNHTLAHAYLAGLSFNALD